MKKINKLLVLGLLVSGLGGCAEVQDDSEMRADDTFRGISQMTEEAGADSLEDQIFYIHIGDTVLTVDAEENKSVDALRKLLVEGNVSISMQDYNGFEKVGSLGQNLPGNDVQMTTEPGDIVLYSGSNLVLFYGSNTWAYTKLGHVKDVSLSELEELLGDGDIAITLSLTE